MSRQLVVIGASSIKEGLEVVRDHLEEQLTLRLSPLVDDLIELARGELGQGGRARAGPPS
jgi:hypothetical protein